MKKNTKYVSEIDQFIGSFLADKEEVSAKRQQLRATWWDKDAEEVEQNRFLEGTDEKHDAYVYFTYPNTK